MQRREMCSGGSEKVTEVRKDRIDGAKAEKQPLTPCMVTCEEQKCFRKKVADQ